VYYAGPREVQTGFEAKHFYQKAVNNPELMSVPDSDEDEGDEDGEDYE
jgi:hypothetical protein